MGKHSFSKLAVLLIIAILIVSSNLAAATTIGGNRQGGPTTNLPPDYTNTNHAGEKNSTTAEFDWSASALTTYEDNKNSVEIIIGADGSSQSQNEITSYANQNGGSVIETISMGENSAVVVSIPANQASTFVNTVHASGVSRYVELNGEYQIYSLPNDPDWDLQWGTQRVGADYAWNTTPGDSSLVVAVIDTGIDYTHPDLIGCYKDGYDFVNNDNDPKDDNGHGTHCAGIIAATINNSIGVAGVAQVKIMAMKGLSATGSGEYADLANCIINATNEGADILSNSWGGSEDSSIVLDAIEYATNQGVLVLAAAGNSNTDGASYPAMYSDVVAVSASNVSDTKASFSNYGSWVDIAAPGVAIYSTFPTYTVTLHEQARFASNYSYASLNGTSMACPMAAGVAALIWSQYPDMDGQAVRDHLESTCDDAGEAGFDIYFGNGIVNASQGVTELPVQHDLLAKTWDAPSYLMLNEVVMLNLTTANRGAQNETNIHISLLVNGTEVNSAIISSLYAYTTNSTILSWTPTETGTYNISYVITPVAEETNLTNNILSNTYTVVDAPEESNWTLLVTNADSSYGCAPKAAYSQLDEEVIFFKVSYYRNWTVAINDIDTGIMIDSDQNASTGMPLDYYWAQEDYIGSEYMILVGNEGTEIWRWNSTIRDWDSNTLPLLYLDAPDNSNTFVVGVSTAAIDVDSFFDCALNDITQVSSNSYYWNWMPDTGYVPFCAQNSQHDLSVTLETERIYAPNVSYTLTAKVFNYGQSSESDVDLELLIDGQVVNSTTFTSISSSAYGEVSYSWAPSEGYFNITAYAAPLSSESITVNNLRTRFVYVSQKIAVISEHDELWTTLNILDAMNINYNYYNYNYYYNITSSLPTLSLYPVVIYYNDGRNITSTELSVLNQYLANGGKLIVTGHDALYYSDAKLAEVVRAISTGDDMGQADLFVVNSTHPIMNGPFGEFATDYHILGLYEDNDAVEANTTQGAVTVAELADGRDKIVATDNLSGTVVFWNGDGTNDWLNNQDCQAVFKNTLIWFLESSGPSTTNDYDGAWHNSAFTINLSVESECGVFQTFYRINNGTIKTVSADGQPQITQENANNTLEYWSTDLYGHEETHQSLIQIKLDTTSPIADAGSTKTVTIGNSVTLDGSGSSDSSGIVSYVWSFGDGTSATGAQVSHTYVNLGTFTATLTVQDVAGNSDSSTVFVVVKAKSTTTTTSTPTPTATPTPTPTPSTNPTTINATIDSGTTIQLSVSGNITATQITNTSIHVNQTAATTTISFNVTGESGTTGFGNITIPKNQVPLGTSPVLYIDGVPAEDYGFTEDADNYYIWYTTHFSTHELSIVFTEIPEGDAPVDYTFWIALTVIATIVCVVAIVFLPKLKSKF